MIRLALHFLPLSATAALAHEGMHHHPHGIEFGWLAAAIVGSLLGGGAVIAYLRRRK